MPTQKKKAKQQDAAKPAATSVQIKSEPLDIKPLSAFVDDRVELIRQAFMCLKPKEITCLAPDAFQGKSIEFIQEQCLDEVLGISTKRLLSIINSTQCPTDTDSSDEEEEKITEHISLDEISSDSEVEVKPQPKKKAAKKTKATDGKKTNSTEASNKNGDKNSEKEMTVLELLELQARARAIRSQLAQEPVTKIELDSDEEAEKAAAPPPASKKTSTTNNSSARAEPAAGTDAGGSSKKTSSSSRTSPAKEQQPKRVRLKRNFRVRQVGDEDVPEEGAQPQQQVEESQKSVSRRESRSKSKEKEKVDKAVEDKPKEEVFAKSRDSSPEVIPVIPSPETLCISSDSEEEKERKKKASIFVDNIEELDRQAKEQAKQQEAKKAAEENDDTEEGEISEEERSRKESIGSAKLDEEKKDSPRKDAKLDHEEELDYDEVREVSDSEPDTSGPAKSLNQTDNQPEAKADDKSSDSSDSDAESSSSNTSSSEGEPEVVEKSKKKEAEEDEEDDPDIVEIHDSSDETLLDQKLAEDEPEKSWGSRWLESNRVAKVMAASRLGNKVRDKLKKKKKKQKQDEEDAAAAAKQAEEEKAEAKPAEEPQPVSTAEVGSVEHYNELMSKADKATEGDQDEAEKPE